jgi:hypothetical protein
VGYNRGWVDPPVTALMPVSQYGRPPLAFRQLGSHCRRQCRQVESLALPARHGKCVVTAGTARQSPDPNFFAGNAGNFTSRQFAVRHASLSQRRIRYL